MANSPNYSQSNIGKWVMAFLVVVGLSFGGYFLYKKIKDSKCIASGDACDDSSHCCDNSETCINGKCASSSGGGGDGGGGGGDSCIASGDACDGSSPCCDDDETCINGKCSDSPSCAPTGMSCSSKTVCCNKYDRCTGGKCVKPAPYNPDDPKGKCPPGSSDAGLSCIQHTPAYVHMKWGKCTSKSCKSGYDVKLNSDLGCTCVKPCLPGFTRISNAAGTAFCSMTKP